MDDYPDASVEVMPSSGAAAGLELLEDDVPEPTAEVVKLAEEEQDEEDWELEEEEEDEEEE
jgi:hypothetical protein